MKTEARWILAAVFVAWLALWVWRVAVGINNPLAPPADSIHSAQGYLSTVDLYLRHDWLTYDSAKEEIVPGFLPGTPMDRFYRSSYLERDVAAFNGGNRSVFRVDNGRILSIDPNRHNITLPFAETRSWKGLLTYRPESGRAGELRGDGIVVSLFGPTKGIRGQERLDEIVVPAQGLSGRQRKDEPEKRVRGEAVNLLDGNGATLGKAHLIGGSILFNNRGYGSGTSISISGETVPSGNRSRIDSGDLLKLRWRRGAQGASQYALLWGSILGEAPVISAYRAVNGQWRRTPADPDLRLAGNVVDALNGAFRRHTRSGAYVIPERRQAEEFDLALTLDAELQDEVQRHLRDYAKRLHHRDETPFRAAVTVMDAKTGELLALASFPSAEDLGDWQEGTAARERLLRNHNFSRLPIGSVAKVILASAILQETPSLASLRIRAYPGGEIDQILGIELDPPMDDHSIPDGGDGWLDFDEFIERSSNKYAATLLTLATAAADGDRLRPPLGDPDVPEELPFQEQFEYQGSLWTRRPDLRLPIARNTRPPERGKGPRPPDLCKRISTLEFLPYAERLSSLFGLEISRKTLKTQPDRQPRRPPGEGDDLVDTSIWMPVLEYLYDGRESIPPDHPFYGASPERENLAYNLMDSYRQQYLSVVLGGGSSTWTMPRVAEIFSRLVTGKQVDANLVRRIRLSDGSVIEPPPQRLPDLPMNPAIRQRIADALTRVVNPEGTAHDLRPVILSLDQSFAAKGKALGFFSKTGSPNNTSFVPTRVARAVDALIANGALRLDDWRRIVYRGTGPVNADRGEDANSSVPSLDALQANPQDMAILRRLGVSPRYVIRVCDTWNDSRPEDRTQFEVSHGKLVRLINTREVKSVGAAYAFTMGLYDGSARTGGEPGGSPPRIDVLHHQPERALTVAIVVEGQGNSLKVAVPLARILIQEVLKNALANGW
ncbi:MAG: hypothetical protein ABUT39_30035 [Acidobacteriota bacterium]